LIEVYTPDGALTQVYINIGSPPRFSGTGFSWTDHELDISKSPGHPARLVDEDEFAAAALRYAYTPAFQIHCYSAAADALRLAESWHPAGL
jgi:predicted RNA-binding protein associated with RNAse of E/G family